MPKTYVGLRVTVNGQFVNRDWIRFRLIESASKHIAGYVVQRHYLGDHSRNSSRSYYKNRSRVTVLWGEFPDTSLSSTFHGYVSHHTVGKMARDSIGQYVDVIYYLIGTSDPMQTKHNWTGYTWSSAAKAIAKRHRMKAVVHQTPKLAKPLIQHVSDFKFLVDGAAKTGFRFFVWNSTLYFVNPQKMLNTRPSKTPMFLDGAIHKIDVTATQAEDPAYISTGLTAQGATVRATTPSGPAEYDPETDQLAPATPEYTATVVESLAEAVQAVQARVIADQQWVTAAVETDGDARVMPGRVVYLTGDKIPDEHEGLWMVNAADHEIDITDTQNQDTYTLIMNLSRDRQRAVTLPASGEDTFIDPEDDNEETIPWDSSDVWQEDTADADPVAIDGVWQAEYYGDDEMGNY